MCMEQVTVLKRGAAPVDPHSGMVGEYIPHATETATDKCLVDTHQVYQNSECVWDAMLNQTDIGKNSNK